MLEQTKGGDGRGMGYEMLRNVDDWMAMEGVGKSSRNETDVLLRVGGMGDAMT